MSKKNTFAALSGILILAATSLATAQTSPVVVQVSGVTQLINAINTANTRTVQTVIEVAPKRYVFSQLFQHAYGRSALPLIRRNIVIRGPSASTTLFDGTGVVRYFAVSPQGRLKLSGITITHASMSCSNPLECTETSGAGGSALTNFGGTVELDRCIVRANSAGDEFESMVGAVYNKAGSLTIRRSTLADNGVGGAGAALAASSGTVLIEDSTFRGNRTLQPGVANNGGYALGGAVALFTGATVTIVRTTFTGNQAGGLDDEPLGHGGAIFNTATLTLRDSTIVENVAQYVGLGGGMYNAGTATVESTTFAGNWAGTRGGGILNSGKLTLRNVTISRNHASVQQPTDSAECEPYCLTGGGGLWSSKQGPWTPNGGGVVDSRASVISSNTAFVTDSGVALRPDCSGIIESRGNNAIGNTNGCQVQRIASTADRLNRDFRLGQLAVSTTPGKSHVPVLRGSQLIDTGGAFPGSCRTRDQIGNARRDGDGSGVVACDIGAIEYQGVP